MKRSLLVLPASLAALALAVAGCSSNTGSGSTASSSTSSSEPTSVTPSSPTAPPSTASTTVTVPPSSSAPANSTTPSSSGTSGQCANGDLSISASEGNGATGHNRYVLYFHNISTSMCTLHGYPGLDALAASGSTLAHAKRTASGFMGGSRKGEPTVQVAPGKYASAIVEWETMQQGTGDACDVQSVKIAVTAANTTRPVVLSRPVATCSLQIHPTVPGRTGDLM